MKTVAAFLAGVLAGMAALALWAEWEEERLTRRARTPSGNGQPEVWAAYPANQGHQ